MQHYNERQQRLLMQFWQDAKEYQLTLALQCLGLNRTQYLHAWKQVHQYSDNLHKAWQQAEIESSTDNHGTSSQT